MRACFFAAPAVSSVDAWLDEFLPAVRSSSRKSGGSRSASRRRRWEERARFAAADESPDTGRRGSDGVRTNQTRPQHSQNVRVLGLS